MPNTEGARDDMRWAHKYLQNFEDKDDIGSLDHAMKYINSARTKDPNVTLQYKDEKNRRGYIFNSQ
jgi:hypothetical protein